MNHVAPRSNARTSESSPHRGLCETNSRERWKRRNDTLFGQIRPSDTMPYAVCSGALSYSKISPSGAALQDDHEGGVSLEDVLGRIAIR